MWVHLTELGRSPCCSVMTTTSEHAYSRPEPLPATSRRALWGLGGFIAAVTVAAVVGSAATRPRIDGWYAEIAKPAFNPPNWVFAPVWTALFLMMAVAAWIVWRRAGWQGARGPLSLWGVQLVLNAFWSVVFFWWMSPGWALVEIQIFLVAVIATTLAFARYSRWAFWLMVPYAVWVAFADLLNAAIWAMN